MDLVIPGKLTFSHLSDLSSSLLYPPLSFLDMMSLWSFPTLSAFELEWSLSSYSLSLLI